jgi:hypothetical protein
MKPEEFSTLEMYGKREIFERKQNEGYTEVAFGGGDWVDSNRIVALWAFYHPTKMFGSVSTLQYPKFDDGTHTIRFKPFERKYSQEGFERYLQKMQIKMGDRENLAKLLQNWDKEEQPKQ